MDFSTGPPPSWHNPCGTLSYKRTTVSSNGLKEAIDKSLFACKIALSSAVHRAQEFVQSMHPGLSLETHHERWRLHQQPWIYTDALKIDKEYNESISERYIETLNLQDNNKLSTILLDIYERFQRLAVGMEQVIIDIQNDNTIIDKNIINDIVENVGTSIDSVLCEVHSIIFILNITKRPNVLRDIMDEQYRNVNGTDRKLRDWIIYREYINQLQFAVEIFEIVQNNIDNTIIE